MKCIFLILLLLIVASFASTPTHVKTNFALSRLISKNIDDCWKINGSLIGGKFNPTLKIVGFKFNCYVPMTKDEIRKLYVEVMEYILFAYNSNDELRNLLDEFPYTPINVKINIRIQAHNDIIGKIENIQNFDNRVLFYYITQDGSIKKESETFDEAYFKVYGRKWNPFKYGDCEIAQ